MVTNVDFLSAFQATAARSQHSSIKTKRMKTLVFIAVFAASAIGARAGDLWQWAPNNWSYTENHGRSWNGFQWAPGHTTWTDNYGHSREVWQ
jgi:hypothetical protein